jgi:hypothetical protein
MRTKMRAIGRANARGRLAAWPEGMRSMAGENIRDSSGRGRQTATPSRVRGGRISDHDARAAPAKDEEPVTVGGCFSCRRWLASGGMRNSVWVPDDSPVTGFAG